jgi:hypothetical protein
LVVRAPASDQTLVPNLSADAHFAQQFEIAIMPAPRRPRTLSGAKFGIGVLAFHEY